MAPCGSWVHISSSVLMPGEEKGLVQGPTGSLGLCRADFQPKLCHLSIISFLRPHPPSVVEVGLGEQGKFALVLFCPLPPQPPTLSSWPFGLGPHCLSQQTLSPGQLSPYQTWGCTEPSNDLVFDSCQAPAGCNWIPARWEQGNTLTTGLSTPLESRGVFSHFMNCRSGIGRFPSYQWNQGGTERLGSPPRSTQQDRGSTVFFFSPLFPPPTPTALWRYN